MSYVSLFNKYRPVLLSHIIGQEIALTSIKNAIKKQQIPGSMLFYGPYGVGKTTIARVISRCINCLCGIMEIPCLKCESCNAITASSHPDVIELDAASNTGVDDVRSIIENAKYSPILSRFKIYIIDEIHMLSNSAFNALLKTLEEPMEHVKFILATTEVHKIPFTIISRCQRFKLSKVKSHEIILNLQNILDKENKHYDDAGLKVIAANSNGSVRDSISLAERYLMYSESLTGCSMQKFGKNDMYALWHSVFTNNVKELLETFDCNDNPVSVLNQMLEYLYIILKVKLGLSLESNEFYGTVPDQKEKEDIIEKFSSVDLELISRMWKILESGIKELASAVNIYASTEILLLHLCYISSLPSPQEIIEKYFGESLHSEPNLKNLVDGKNTSLRLSTKTSVPGSNIATNDHVQQQKPHIDPMHVKNLLMKEEDFRPFFDGKVKKIGILNNIVTFYTVKSVDDKFIKAITEFLTFTFKNPWKVEVEVIDLPINPLASKVLEEFSGAKIISQHDEESF